MDQIVVRERFDHEQGKIYASGHIAFKNWIADVPAPYRQALTVALFEVASTYDSPPGIAVEHSPTCLHLIVKVDNTDKSRQPADNLQKYFELA